MTLQALIFDVDGTLAETEECHREAFNQAFAEFDMDWNWDQSMYRQLLKTTGGKERMRAYAKMQGVECPDVFKLHAHKTEIYNNNIMTGKVALRPGIERIIKEAEAQGRLLAIATTTSLPNVHSLLRVNLGEESLNWFTCMATAEDVDRKKPDPEVYEVALRHLGVDPCHCLAFEDSWNGLQSALDANIPTIITPSIYTDDQDFAGALCVVSHFGEAERPCKHLAGKTFGAECPGIEELDSLIKG